MDKYYETQTMELKEKYTDSIVKEIVSFLKSSYEIELKSNKNIQYYKTKVNDNEVYAI